MGNVNYPKNQIIGGLDLRYIENLLKFKEKIAIIKSKTINKIISFFMISPISRPIRKSDVFDLKGSTMLQLALEFEDTRHVDRAVHNLVKNVFPLHVKAHGDILITHNDPVPVYFIPKIIRTPEDAAFFTAKNYTRPFNKSLASIASGGNFVVLNINHMFSDGAYFKFLTEHILEESTPKLNFFPLKTDDLFMKEIEKSTVPMSWSVDPYISRIRTNGKPKEDSLFASYQTIKLKKNELMCYDKQTGKIHGLTEALWLSHVLASFKHKKNIENHCGVCTCIDMRKYLKEPITYEITNCFSSVSPSTSINKNMKLSEVGQLLRENMNMKLKRGDHFGFYKGLGAESEQKEIPGIGLEITNMGSLPIKKPIVNAWVSLHAKTTNVAKIVSLMSYSVKDDLYVRLRYGSGALTHDEMKEYAKSVEFTMRNIPYDISVKEAYNLLLSSK